MSDYNHKVWCLANDWNGSKPCNCGAPSELAAPAEMLELPNDTKIRFCNAFDAIKAHCILCKECDLYLRWGDGDLCSTGKAMIALEMCYTDTSIVFPLNEKAHLPAPAGKVERNQTEQ